MRKKARTVHRTVHSVGLKGYIVKGRDDFYHIRIEVVRPSRFVDYEDTDKRKFKTVEEAVKELFALIGDKWEFGGVEASFYQEIGIDIPTVKFSIQD